MYAKRCFCTQYLVAAQFKNVLAYVAVRKIHVANIVASING